LLPYLRLAQLAASAANINLTAFGGVDVNMCSGPAGSAVSGAYLQARSQFPGEGPCYPVWAATVPYFNRCARAWLCVVCLCGGAELVVCQASCSTSHGRAVPRHTALHTRATPCRCFPKFPANFSGALYSTLNSTAGVLSAAASTAQDEWAAGGSLFGTYVADIIKGVLIIVIGGLGCGMVLSLVSMRERAGARVLSRGWGLRGGQQLYLEQA
jgi:hypothetical protein